MKSVSSVYSVLVLLCASLFASFTASAADPFYQFTVAKNGHVYATVEPSSAQFENHMYTVINGVKSGVFLNNHSPVGTIVDFGKYHKGDHIQFRVDVMDTGDTWWSNPAKNSDHLQHMKVDFNSKGMHLSTGFEDIRGGGDFDYNDMNGLWKNVHVAAVPEPETYLMMLFGLLIVVYAVKSGKFKQKTS